MARIKLHKKHTMPKEDVLQAAQDLAAKLERKHGVRAKWRGDSVSMRAPSIEGYLAVTDDTIEVSVKLGMLASSFAPRLEREIQRYLDEYVC